MPTSEDRVTTSRPLGVSIIAIILAVYAAWVAFGVAVGLTHQALVHRLAGPGNEMPAAISIVLIGPTRSLLAATISAGLWRLRDWARRGVPFLFLCGIAVRVMVAGMFSPANVARALTDSLSDLGVFRISLMLIIIGYLYQPRVANVFRGSSRY